MTRRVLTPEGAAQSPESAILAILDTTLHALTCTVLALHPDLFRDDDECPYWVPTTPSSADTRSAEALLDCADRLRTAIRAYQRAAAHALRVSLPEDDTIPF